jgi:hypothetical protein
MAFLIKLGSMTIVTSTALEAMNAVDKFLADNPLPEPVIRTFDGAKIEIERLRSMVAGEPVRL